MGLKDEILEGAASVSRWVTHDPDRVYDVDALFERSLVVFHVDDVTKSTNIVGPIAIAFEDVLRDDTGIARLVPDQGDDIGGSL